MTPKQLWERDGFLTLPNLIDPAAIDALREACEFAFEKWKRESTPDNQPGAFAYAPDAWIMLHLNHPAHYGGRADLLTRLLDAVATPAAIDAVTEVFGKPPIFMQANYYIDPPSVPANQGGRWHRDCEFFARGDKAVEQRMVADEATPPRELHMHIPLVPTSATGVVPGSHKRWDTPEEAEARAKTPFTHMPGGIRLPMKPGDVGFFHVNTLHRGYYEVGVPRRTIAVTFGSQDHLRPFDPDWWAGTRGYVATYQPWCKKPGYLDHASPNARKLFDRFIATYGHEWTRDKLRPEVIGEPRVAYFTHF